MLNTIKPVRGNVIVSPISKESHYIKNEFGQEVELFVDTSYSWDGKIKNSTQGVLLTDYKNLKAGTNVLFNHNALSDYNILDIKYNGNPVHAFEEQLLYFGVDGEEIICVDGMMVAERIFDEDELSPGGIILTEKKKQDSLLKILAKADDIEDINVGDTVVVYKFSDYEIHHNIGGKKKFLIRLKYTDCLAIWEY